MILWIGIHSIHGDLTHTIVLLADVPPTPKVVRLFSKQNLGLYTGAAGASSSQTYDIPLPFQGSCLRRRSNECSSYHLIGVAVHVPHLFSAIIFFPILFSFFFLHCVHLSHCH